MIPHTDLDRNSNPHAVPIEFAPADPDRFGDSPVQPGTGSLLPNGLVLHTSWSVPLEAKPGERYEQHQAFEGCQAWHIATPDGHRAAHFDYSRFGEAAAVAEQIAAALPDGRWPAGTTATNTLLQAALEASAAPDLLPLDREGKRRWGWGASPTYFTMPRSRAAYEALIAAHGKEPKNCQDCATIRKARRKSGWDIPPRHWPAWGPQHPAGTEKQPHCWCARCLFPTTIGAIIRSTREDGTPEPLSAAVGLYTPFVNDDDTSPVVPCEQRPFAWAARFLNEAGCLILDNRECAGLWPVGIRHDDALFCETGLGGIDDLDDDLDEDGFGADETGTDLLSPVGGSACAATDRADTVIAGGIAGRPGQEVGR